MLAGAVLALSWADALYTMRMSSLSSESLWCPEMIFLTCLSNISIYCYTMLTVGVRGVSSIYGLFPGAVTLPAVTMVLF
jgi:hypothetical protein